MSLGRNPRFSGLIGPNRAATAAGAVGDITGVIAGNGLTGGGLSGTVTLDLGESPNSGLTVTADSVTVDATVIRTTSVQVAYARQFLLMGG